MALTAERLRERLDYDPDNGVFTWRFTRGRAKEGAVAGCICPTYGYRMIGLDGVVYRAARLAWLYMHGEWPPDEIDHCNHNRADDSWTNLRNANRTQQQANRGRQKNNTSGFKGVTFHAETGKWRARVVAGRRTTSLGLHETAEQAHQAYVRAAHRIHREFAAEQ